MPDPTPPSNPPTPPPAPQNADDLIRMAASIPKIETFAADQGDLDDSVLAALETYKGKLLDRAAVAIRDDAAKRGQPGPEVVKASDGLLYSYDVPAGGVPHLDLVEVLDAATVLLAAPTPTPTPPPPPVPGPVPTPGA